MCSGVRLVKVELVILRGELHSMHSNQQRCCIVTSVMMSSPGMNGSEYTTHQKQIWHLCKIMNQSCNGMCEDMTTCALVLSHDRLNLQHDHG